MRAWCVVYGCAVCGCVDVGVWMWVRGVCGAWCVGVLVWVCGCGCERGAGCQTKKLIN